MSSSSGSEISGSSSNSTICDPIVWRIEDGIHPHLICTLSPTHKVVAEAGAMVYMDEHIEMETKMGDGRGGKKGYPFSGLFQAIGRKLTKQGLFMTHFSNSGVMDEEVSFTGPVAGAIVPIDLGQTSGNKIICQKGAFLAASYGSKLTWVVSKKLSAGFFGGEGWFLQEISGDGMAFLSVSGSVVRKDLAYGQTLRMGMDCLVGWTEDTTISVSTVKRIASLFFGREGLFLSKATGPGTVFIQTMPIRKMVTALISALPQPKKGQKNSEE